MKYCNEMNWNEGDKKVWVMEIRVAKFSKPRREFDFLGSVTKLQPMSWTMTWLSLS